MNVKLVESLAEIEFWNVYTRPANRNGLGYSPEEAAEEIQRLKGLFLLLPERPTIYAEWERLVVNYGVSGVNVHDARLVAAMCAHGLTHILNFTHQKSPLSKGGFRGDKM